MTKSKDVKTSTYIIDDAIVYDKIDELLTSIDPSTLNMIKNDDYLMPEERESVDNDDYEEYNFEEEELEEDDYYNDDLD